MEEKRMKKLQTPKCRFKKGAGTARPRPRDFARESGDAGDGPSPLLSAHFLNRRRYSAAFEIWNLKFLWGLGFGFWSFVLCCLAAEPTPLLHAHAHNDYEHTHPLFDALEQGFCSVEA